MPPQRRFSPYRPFIAALAPVFMLLLLLAGLGSGGCDVFVTDGEDDDGTGIVVGEHIEGVMLTDDSSEVRDKLGAPDEFVRGDFPSVTYRYTDGPAAGLEVEIATDSLEVAAPGEVVTACAYAPYDGETEKGVGIGTPREKTHRLLGVPKDTLAPSWNTEEWSKTQGWYDEYSLDEYFFRNVRFRLDYRADQNVHSICIEPKAGEGYMMTKLEGTIEQLENFPPRFAIRPDYHYGSRWITKGNRIPKAFRRDSLRVVFTARALPTSPRGPRRIGYPLHLVSINKLE